MHKITVRLTDEEYSALETQAQTQRRSVREMAGFLVARPQPSILVMPFPTPLPPFNPLFPPRVWGGTTATPPSNGTIMGNSSALPIGVNSDA